MKNYYEILEVDKNASNEIIKNAYKTLVKKYHPDLNEDDEKENAEEAIKKINEAYDVLSNPESKAKYDATLTEHNIPIEQYNLLYNENIELKQEINRLKNNYKNSYSNYNNSAHANSQYHNYNYSSQANPQYDNYSNSSQTNNSQYRNYTTNGNYSSNNYQNNNNINKDNINNKYDNPNFNMSDNIFKKIIMIFIFFILFSIVLFLINNIAFFRNLLSSGDLLFFIGIIVAFYFLFWNKK